MFVSLAIFSWRNVKRSLKPNTVTLEHEIESNKKRGFWMDFDSYNKVEYEIKGKNDYILHAMFVDNEDVRGTGKYVILCHGHTNNRYGSVKYVHCFMKLGYSCIIYDARHHGLNKPDICTMGNIESDDLKCVIEDTRARYPDIKVLGLHGESMGSSTSLSVTRYNPDIDFIVADCGFTVAPPINLAGIILYHVDMRKTCAIEHLENNKYPILFIHGSGDRLVKPYHSQKLYDVARKNGAYCELIFVEGAGHARSRAVAGFEQYTAYIENFLKHINL